jgi:hypothetical protein
MTHGKTARSTASHKTLAEIDQMMEGLRQKHGRAPPMTPQEKEEAEDRAALALRHWKHQKETAH